MHAICTKGQVEKSLYGHQGPRDPSGYEGPKFDQKMTFSEWVPLVGKMIPDLVGVFWDHLGVCTMGFWDPRGCAMIFPRVFHSLTPIGPFKGPVYGRPRVHNTH